MSRINTDHFLSELHSRMKGFQLADYVTAILFIVLTTIVVLIRYAVRIHIKGFGLDDWLMVFGHILYVAACVTAILAAYSGLGVKDKFLTVERIINTRHNVFNFELIYCASFMFIKSSIGFALLRINNNRYIKWTIYAVMFIAVASGFIPLVIIGSICTPISGIWTGVGHCRDFAQLYGVIVFLTITSICTDIALCVLPFLILWNLQMKRSKKLIIVSLLSLTFISSGVTVVRAFYFKDFVAIKDYSYRIARPGLYSIIELGTGIIFASMPAIKPLLRILNGTDKLSSRYNQSTRLKTEETEAGSGPVQYYKMEVLKSSNNDRPIGSDDDEEELIRNNVIVVSSEYDVRTESVKE